MMLLCFDDDDDRSLLLGLFVCDASGIETKPLLFTVERDELVEQSEVWSDP